jgi:colicin import membrane protein
MTPQAYSEPHKYSAGALALLVHGIFFSLLYFGFNWHVKTPESVMVEMWDHLPEPEHVAQPQPEPLPPPPAPEPITPKVETPPTPKVAPPVVVAKPAIPQKADIELKETKKKKAAKEKEEKPAPAAKPDNKAKKLEQEKQKALAAQAEQAKAEEAKQQAKAEEMARERAEEERSARENERTQELKAKIRAEADAAVRSEVDRYRGLIQAKIKRSIVMPPDVADNAVAEFAVTVLPDGSVLTPKLLKSSGNPAYDNAAERAILRAQPLPMPPDTSIARMFRELHLSVKP